MNPDDMPPASLLPEGWRLPKDDEALAAECEFESFRAGGPGGQHVNTTDSAVRLRHRPSGLAIVARESRSQHDNRADALRKLREALIKITYKPKKRHATQPTKASKARNSIAKARRSDVKKGRGRIRGED
ncbi:MAG: hypothetical protein RL095_2798 [Verrucomicrobiota bacterium]|jgi:protein subunit release factor B